MCIAYTRLYILVICWFVTDCINRLCDVYLHRRCDVVILDSVLKVAEATHLFSQITHMDRTLNRIAESLNLLLVKEREGDSARGKQSGCTHRPSVSLGLPGPQDSLSSYEQLSSTNLILSHEDS